MGYQIDLFDCKTHGLTEMDSSGRCKICERDRKRESNQRRRARRRAEQDLAKKTYTEMITDHINNLQLSCRRWG